MAPGECRTPITRLDTNGRVRLCTCISVWGTSAMKRSVGSLCWNAHQCLLIPWHLHPLSARVAGLGSRQSGHPREYASHINTTASEHRCGSFCDLCRCISCVGDRVLLTWLGCGGCCLRAPWQGLLKCTSARSRGRHSRSAATPPLLCRSPPGALWRRRPPTRSAQPHNAKAQVAVCDLWYSSTRSAQPHYSTAQDAVKFPYGNSILPIASNRVVTPS